MKSLTVAWFSTDVDNDPLVRVKPRDLMSISISAVKLNIETFNLD